jgi:hypothetical protein
MNEVVILSIPGVAPWYQVRRKLEALELKVNWWRRLETNRTEFTIAFGISENDRQDLENIIKGLINLFGEN